MRNGYSLLSGAESRVTLIRPGLNLDPLDERDRHGKPKSPKSDKPGFSQKNSVFSARKTRFFCQKSWVFLKTQFSGEELGFSEKLSFSGRKTKFLRKTKFFSRKTEFFRKTRFF